MDHKGEGDVRFWQLAVDLRSAGMSIDEIEHKLQEEAQYGRSPTERRGQIPSIMQSLGQRYRKAG